MVEEYYIRFDGQAETAPRGLTRVMKNLVTLGPLPSRGRFLPANTLIMTIIWSLLGRPLDGSSPGPPGYKSFRKERNSTTPQGHRDSKKRKKP